MKKLMLLFVCLFALQLVARADNEQPIQLAQLPHKAQQFIKKHFAGRSIAMAKVETDWLEKTYDVIFTNGNKVEFDKAGDWKEVDCQYDSVPIPVIPTAILKYITANYPGIAVLKIDKDKRDYEVKLANKMELKFDLRFNLIGVDS